MKISNVKSSCLIFDILEDFQSDTMQSSGKIDLKSGQQWEHQFQYKSNYEVNVLSTLCATSANFSGDAFKND